jgi:hypothetical protein
VFGDNAESWRQFHKINDRASAQAAGGLRPSSRRWRCATVAPPTISLTSRPRECNLDYVPGVAREMKIGTVMSNSFGFGGTNASLILRKPD